MANPLLKIVQYKNGKDLENSLKETEIVLDDFLQLDAEQRKSVIRVLDLTKQERLVEAVKTELSLYLPHLGINEIPKLNNTNSTTVLNNLFSKIPRDNVPVAVVKLILNDKAKTDKVKLQEILALEDQGANIIKAVIVHGTISDDYTIINNFLDICISEKVDVKRYFQLDQEIDSSELEMLKKDLARFNEVRDMKKKSLSEEKREFKAEFIKKFSHLASPYNSLNASLIADTGDGEVIFKFLKATGLYGAIISINPFTLEPTSFLRSIIEGGDFDLASEIISSKFDEVKKLTNLKFDPKTASNLFESLIDKAAKGKFSHYELWDYLFFVAKLSSVQPDKMKIFRSFVQNNNITDDFLQKFTKVELEKYKAENNENLVNYNGEEKAINTVIDEFITKFSVDYIAYLDTPLNIRSNSYIANGFWYNFDPTIHRIIWETGYPSSPIMKDALLFGNHDTVKSWKAIFLGEVENVEFLLNWGLDIETIDENFDRTLLLQAIHRKQKDIVDLLIKRGANIQAKDRLLNSALHFGYDSIEILKLILAKDAKLDVNAFNDQGKSPLYLAVESNNLEAVKILIVAGAGVSLNDPKGSYSYSKYSNKQHNLIELVLDNNYLPNRDEMLEILIRVKGKEKKGRIWGDKELTAAVEKGVDISIVKKLVDAGATLNADNTSALKAAIIKNKLDLIPLLVQAKANVNADLGNAHSRGTLLKYAIWHGNADLVEALINAGASLEAEGEYGYGTPLHQAIAENRASIVKLLVDKGANMEATNHGSTCLSNAITISFPHQNTDIIETLLKAGADIGDGQLLYGAKKNKQDAVVKLIKEAEKSRTIESETPLYTAIRKGDLELVKSSLQSGYVDEGALVLAIQKDQKEVFECLVIEYNKSQNHNQEYVIRKALELGAYEMAIFYILNASEQKIEKRKEIALKVATDKNLPEFVEALIKNKVDLNKLDGWGQTPLYYAIKNGKNSIAILLINNSANLNIKCNGLHIKQTAINLAIEEDNAEIAKYLIEKGDDIEVSYETGGAYNPAQKGYIEEFTDTKETALHHAITKGNVEIVKALLEKKANIEALNTDGETALIHAMKAASPSSNIWHLRSDTGKVENYKKIINMLLDQGANVNVSDTHQKTALHYAVEMDDIEVLKKILEKTKNVDAQDGLGRTPVLYAMERSNIYKPLSPAIELLTNKGSDLFINDKKDKNVMDYLNGYTSKPDYIFNSKSMKEHESILRKKISKTLLGIGTGALVIGIIAFAAIPGLQLLLPVVAVIAVAAVVVAIGVSLLGTGAAVGVSAKNLDGKSKDVTAQIAVAKDKPTPVVYTPWATKIADFFSHRGK